MLASLLIRSLSFVVFGFECAAIGFDVSGFLAIIAGSVDSPKTCFGFADLSAVGKNFFLGCSVGRPNLVLRRLRLPSLLQNTFSELLRSRLRS